MDLLMSPLRTLLVAHKVRVTDHFLKNHMHNLQLLTNSLLTLALLVLSTNLNSLRLNSTQINPSLLSINSSRRVSRGGRPLEPVRLLGPSVLSIPQPTHHHN